MVRIKKTSIKLFLMLGIVMLMYSSCGVMTTMWSSIKDRYKPYEFVGQEGEKVQVKFVYDSPSASTVWLAGAFNNWQASTSLPKYPEVDFSQQNAVINLERNQKTQYWEVVIPLSPGRYQYKYVLDEGRVWEPDLNTEHVDDNFGGKNSIIIVVAQ